MRSLRGASLILALLAAAPSARAFTKEERAIIDSYGALLEVSADPCRLASRLGSEYKRILSSATAAQDVADLKGAIPFRLAYGLRISEGFALYDDETETVYLSSRSLEGRLPRTPGACASDEILRNLARDTVGVYVHEVSHSLERKALGKEMVNTREGEVLAYARESRFLAGLKGWPSGPVKLELKRLRLLEENFRNNQEIIGWVEELKGQADVGAGLKKLEKYVGLLEELKQSRQRLQAVRTGADPFQVSLGQMVEAWERGWPAFLHFALEKIGPRPSLSDREKNLEASRRFLAAARAGIKEEAAGTLAYQMARRSVRLGEQDVAFWGDEKTVAQALAFYKRRFKEVRPPPKAAPRPSR